MRRSKQFIEALKRELSNPANPHLKAAKQAMAEKMIELIQASFETKSRGQTDVTGVQWEPTKEFTRTRRAMLIKTKRLLKGFEFHLTDSGFQIFNRVPYADFQFKKRKPLDTKRLPENWLKQIASAATPHLTKLGMEAAQSLSSSKVRVVVDKR